MHLTSLGPGHRDDLVFAPVAADGSLDHTIARTPGMLRYEGPGWTGPSPLSPSAMWALRNDVLYLGETLTPRIERFDADGAELGAIAWESKEGLPPEEAFQEVRKLAVEKASPTSRERVRARLQDALLPEHVPVFTTFLVDALGFVWVRPYLPTRDASALGGPLYATPAVGGTWRVFAPSGGRVGSVVIPDALELDYIGEDALVGVHRDEIGVESVQIYRVHRD